MDILTRDEAIEQLDWYFNEDDGIAADNKTHTAYSTLRIIAFSYNGCSAERKDFLVICPVCRDIMKWNDIIGRYQCPTCGAWDYDEEVVEE